MGQRLSFSALFQFFYSYPLRPPGGVPEAGRGGRPLKLSPAPSGRGREENAARAAWRGFKHFSAWLNSFYNYPLCPPGRASEGPVVGNLRFPPRGPSLQPPPESPVPFRVERLPARPASSCSNKSSAFGTLGLVGTGSHGGARPGPTSYRHPSRRTARPKVWGFSGRARTPAIPPTAGRGTHEG